MFMNQVVTDKMQRKIMVVKNEILFSKKPSQEWFLPKSDNYEEIILNSFEYMIRGEAEKNFSYKQPIPYGVVINEQKEIFVYKRWWSWSNAWDSRLHSKISFWVGWHIEIDDTVNKNLLRESLLRELEEEIMIKESDVLKVEVLWYINDNSNEVWKVHFWIAYIIEITNTKISMEDGELENGEFLSISQIDEMIKSWNYDIENWSNIMYHEIKKYLA